jgi:hypothetical protein
MGNDRSTIPDHRRPDPCPPVAHSSYWQTPPRPTHAECPTKVRWETLRRRKCTAQAGLLDVSRDPRPGHRAGHSADLSHASGPIDHLPKRPIRDWSSNASKAPIAADTGMAGVADLSATAALTRVASSVATNFPPGFPSPLPSIGRPNASGCPAVLMIDCNGVGSSPGCCRGVAPAVGVVCLFLATGFKKATCSASHDEGRSPV